jgi:hypothetical protein
MISLFALIITLGIVVDDAIVVGEHADYRYRTLGEDPVTAAENAARRMAAPVFSATITTVLAFAGLVFVGGRFGDADRRHPLHGDRRAPGEPRGMLPHPAQPHGPCAGAFGQGSLVRHALARREPGLRMGARPAVPPAHGLGDLGALPGAGRHDPGSRRRSRCSCAAT